jgi:hypothetical protein
MLVRNRGKIVVPNFVVDSFRAPERVSVVPYIRKKFTKGAAYHYLVHCERVGNRVRQRVLCYLGKHATVKAALRYWKRQADTATDTAGKRKASRMVQKLKTFLK